MRSVIRAGMKAFCMVIGITVVTSIMNRYLGCSAIETKVDIAVGLSLAALWLAIQKDEVPNDAP